MNSDIQASRSYRLEGAPLMGADYQINDGDQAGGADRKRIGDVAKRELASLASESQERKGCQAKKSVGSSVREVFSSVIRKKNCAEKVDGKKNHSIKPSSTSLQTNRNVLADLQVLEQRFANYRFEMPDGRLVGVLEAAKHIPSDEWESRAVHFVKSKTEDGINYIHVSSGHRFAKETSITLDGEEWIVVGDLDTKELIDSMNEYERLLKLQVEEKTNEVGTKSVAFYQPLPTASTIKKRNVPVVVVPPGPDHLFRKTLAFVLIQAGRKEGRDEERRQLQKDEEKAAVIRGVIKEGVKKEEIISEAIRYDDTHL